MGDQVTPPPTVRLGHGSEGHARRPSSPHWVGRPWASSAGHAPAAPVAATWMPPWIRWRLPVWRGPHPSAKPAIVVAVLLLAAAGIGYLKLQSDTQAFWPTRNAKHYAGWRMRARKPWNGGQGRAAGAGQAQGRRGEGRADGSRDNRGSFRRAGRDRSVCASIICSYRRRVAEAAQVIGAACVRGAVRSCAERRAQRGSAAATEKEVGQRSAGRHQI